MPEGGPGSRWSARLGSGPYNVTVTTRSPDRWHRVVSDSRQQLRRRVGMLGGMTQMTAGTGAVTFGQLGDVGYGCCNFVARRG